MPNRLLHACVLCVALCSIALASPAQTASGPIEAAPASFLDMVAGIQRMLTELGYRPGATNGRMSDRTRQSIKRYQSNTGLPADGHPSPALYQHLRVTTGRAPAAAGTGAATPAVSKPSRRPAAWQGEVVSALPLRIAPSGASASTQQLAEGTALEVIRRQGAWLEVRVRDSGAEGWVKQVGVRPVGQTAAAPKKKSSGGFFANLARGVTRLLGGASDEPQDQGTVTVGIRGLSPEDLETTIPDAGELERMEGFRADRDQAFRFAAEEQLTVQTIDYLPSPQPGGGAAVSSGRRDE